MRPGEQDWKCGGKLYAMPEACFQHVVMPKACNQVVVAPAACPGPRSGGGAEEMIKDLKANVFPTEPIRFVAVSKEGKKASLMHR